MAMGDYDEDEHERRERLAGSIDADFDDDRETYEGQLSYDSGESTEDLLDQFDQIKSD
jgi:hypothetical protein